MSQIWNSLPTLRVIDAAYLLAGMEPPGGLKGFRGASALVSNLLNLIEDRTGAVRLATMPGERATITQSEFQSLLTEFGTQAAATLTTARQAMPLMSVSEWQAFMQKDDEARQDPAYKAEYDRVSNLYAERDNLQREDRENGPYRDPKIFRRLSEIRYELAEVGKAAETQSAASTAAPPQAVPNDTKPISRATAQNAAILAEIRRLGHDPLKFPKAESGKRGVKAGIREKLTQDSKGTFVSIDVFDDAWQRLRNGGEICDE